MTPQAPATCRAGISRSMTPAVCEQQFHYVRQQIQARNMAGCALAFERGGVFVYQVLAGR